MRALSVGAPALSPCLLSSFGMANGAVEKFVLVKAAQIYDQSSSGSAWDSAIERHLKPKPSATYVSNWLNRRDCSRESVDKL